MAVGINEYLYLLVLLLTKGNLNREPEGMV